MLIDVHCHFFTKNILAERLKRNDWIAAMLSRASKRQDTGKGLRLFRGMNAVRFLRVGFENTPQQMYEYMADIYGGEFIAVPLMLDLSYAMTAPKAYRERHAQDWRSEASESEGALARARDRRLAIWERTMFGFDVFDDSYTKQIEELTELKRALPDRVYPFFSVDPRRNDEFEGGVVGEIARHVGKTEPFIGLKLYSSLGYSPTDPVLYDNSERESVYGYCEKNGIPVTAHAAGEGFSHMLRRSSVDGDVYDAREDRLMPAHELFDDGVITHRYRLRSFDYDNITKERLTMLNHPKLWRKVLEKYPKLKLNLAHFGGLNQSYAYLKHGDETSWTLLISDIMRDFENVYTDLSFFYEHDERPGLLGALNDRVYKKLPRKVRSRVMYGSDYFMGEMYDAGMPEYYASFQNVFGKELAALSEESAARFLDL